MQAWSSGHALESAWSWGFPGQHGMHPCLSPARSSSRSRGELSSTPCSSRHLWHPGHGDSISSVTHLLKQSSCHIRRHCLCMLSSIRMGNLGVFLVLLVHLGMQSRGLTHAFIRLSANSHGVMVRSWGNCTDLWITAQWWSCHSCLHHKQTKKYRKAFLSLIKRKNSSYANDVCSNISVASGLHKLNEREAEFMVFSRMVLTFISSVCK